MPVLLDLCFQFFIISISRRKRYRKRGFCPDKSLQLKSFQLKSFHVWLQVSNDPNPQIFDKPASDAAEPEG